MRLVIVSGLSGSGKSVALHVLEDLGFYCIDNIPVGLLRSFVDEILPRRDAVYENVGVGLDARSPARDLAEIPPLVQQLRDDGVACEVIFLQAADQVLLSRFSETRRKHPLTDKNTSLAEAIAKERELLGPLINTAELVIDTTGMTVYALREQIRDRVAQRLPGALSILVESFGYKHGLPASADFVFDVRCLPNPHWEPQLRHRTGLETPVVEYMERHAEVHAMYEEVRRFLETWLPRFEREDRTYVTVALGCTGGMHRSVYLVHRLATHFAALGYKTQVRHRELK
jgi:RNase adapter protein RapZ